MSLSFWHSVATILAMIAFFGVCWWAYSPANRKRFDDDADIAISTDPLRPKPEVSDTDSREKRQ
jgi:cytochrome c oxidase cbb3-type subunit 4